jgi:hypothetical protein
MMRAKRVVIGSETSKKNKTTLTWQGREPEFRHSMQGLNNKEHPDRVPDQDQMHQSTTSLIKQITRKRQDLEEGQGVKSKRETQAIGQTFRINKVSTKLTFSTNQTRI